MDPPLKRNDVREKYGQTEKEFPKWFLYFKVCLHVKDFILFNAPF